MYREVVTAPKMTMRSRAYGIIPANEISTISSRLPFMVTGKRFQEPGLNGSKQIVSPASPFGFGSRLSLQNRNTESRLKYRRPKIPVTVVGYPDSVRNKKYTGSADVEHLTAAGKAASDGKMSLRESCFPKTGVRICSNCGLNRFRSKADDDKKSNGDKKRKTNIRAPWRENSAFQTPAERRRQMFHNLKMMSLDPTTSPTKTPSNQTAKTVVIKLQTNEPTHGLHRKSAGSSMSIHSKKWSSRDLVYRNLTADGLAGSGSGKLKGKITTGSDKSTTGLALNFRAHRDYPPVKVKNAPSTVAHPRIKRKYNTMSPVLIPKKSVGAVTLANTPAPSLVAMFLSQPTGGQQGSANTDQSYRWNTVQPNSTTLSPSKRLEQARFMNHIIQGHAGSNPNSSSRNDIIRDKFSTPGYNAAHRFSNSVKPNPPNPPIPPSAPKPSKPQILPPVHVPSPKRENIYIGQYDGSDDSDSDTDTPNKLSNVPPSSQT